MSMKAAMNDQLNGENGFEEEQQEQDASAPAAAVPIKITDWFFYPFFIAAFLGVLCFFDVAQRVIRPFGMKAHERAVRWLNFFVMQSVRVLGTRIMISGDRDHPPGMPYIIISNHQSMFDISILHHCFNALRPRFIAKKELAYWIPGVSYCLRYEGSAIIDRSNKTQAIKEIVKLGRRMRDLKFAAILFPEGTRARDGRMKRFRPAGFSVLMKTLPQAPIIPVAIDGSWRFGTRKYGPLPTFETINVRIGHTLHREGKTDAELLQAAEEIVSGLLEEIRGQSRN